ncbi:hypothetical protein AB0Y20_01500 [Heyndrickxia oleronia]|uniref:hypothetical protein n=1 Tax=Heyndrickxia oleronia TaxID=38875 RepID=UPI003F26F71A
MSSYKNIQDILNVVWNDEDLLRLLTYEPKRLSKEKLDPLDPSLDNILDKDIEELWNIRNDKIMLTPKDDDLIDKRKCRLFIYLGDRNPDRGNYYAAKQLATFDILVHSDFENGDMRTTRIGDRLNELFALRHVAGFGKIDYVRGRGITRTPSQYVGYQHVYNFTVMKQC